jgi:riboflavin-specific deaminase-like protein
MDGKIAGADGSSKWISGPETLELAHELRGENDAILVGIGTVLADDPELSCRIADCASPLRVILDSTARLPLHSRIAETAEVYATVVMTGEHGGDEAAARAAALEKRHVSVEHCRHGSAGLSPEDVLERLGRRGVESLFVEGGGGVLTSFLRAGLIDRLLVVIAPIILGAGVPAFGDLGIRSLSEAMEFRTVSTQTMGRDLVWELQRE